MIFALTGLVTPAPKFELTIESIMRGYALVGHSPRRLRWSEDGTKVGFSWAKADGTQNEAYKNYTVDADGSNLKEDSLPRTERKPWEGGSKLGFEVAYEKLGDIYIHNLNDGSDKNLTDSKESESSPVYARDGQSIVFRKGPNWYRLSLVDKKTTQLTQPKSDTNSTDVPVTIDPPKDFMAGGSTVSPSGTHVAVSLFERGAADQPAQVASFINSSSYVELVQTYPRVGGPQSHSQVRIYNLANCKSFDISTPRPGTVRQIQWSPDGKYGVAWGFAEDHKDAWLFEFDTTSEKVATMYDEHDNAWVGGAFDGSLGWLPNSSKFYFLSENSGYANLMTMRPTDEKATDITDGQFEVSNVQMDEDRGRFVFVSSEGSPFDRHIDAVSFDGGARRKLADYSAGDDSEFAISPDGTKIAVVKSKSDHPAELFLNGKQITETPSAEWLSGPWIDPPIVMVPARDGVKVPAKLYKPKDWRKGGPAVVFVHGAGYLQNVFNGWSYYYREYMFHHLLMDHGYAVLDIDYRASAGYGKAWRTAIYRHMGGTDLNDVVDGAKYMVDELGAAPDRLGVYGGSYGGFITLMAMFTSPDTFKSGAALRPVGDWANYHHGYTSPILNTPQEDPEAYKVSSPINFVDGLKGNLLICHGMVDTNVQFQDSVRVVEKLIELGKKNWSVAPYPVENHAFTKPESWTDEYNRIFDLFERTIGTKRKD
ncbi:MAG: prolyl oligopeptidase family serine peptidase [Armatimonadetes bacterium]|nr:prolyl oligopeptidase family serine peptidase [Armatimonadota bacterium]